MLDPPCTVERQSNTFRPALANQSKASSNLFRAAHLGLARHTHVSITFGPTGTQHNPNHALTRQSGNSASHFTSIHQTFSILSRPRSSRWRPHPNRGGGQPASDHGPQIKNLPLHDVKQQPVKARSQREPRRPTFRPTQPSGQAVKIGSSSCLDIPCGDRTRSTSLRV